MRTHLVVPMRLEHVQDRLDILEVVYSGTYAAAKAFSKLGVEP